MSTQDIKMGLYPVETELRELEKIIQDGRASGRSTHIMFRIVNDLFENPINTKILVEDHVRTKQGTQELMGLIKKFLSTFCPPLQYKFHVEEGKTYIIRTEKTYRERIFHRIEELSEQLEK